jgi:hypothetical protein
MRVDGINQIAAVAGFFVSQSFAARRQSGWPVRATRQSDGR